MTRAVRGFTFGGLPIKVISFVMSRKMMLENKRLAESKGGSR